ncbi:glycosyltransferase family 4 protein [Pseudomonas guariconensis]|uniref:glycosyltransferase family 4 protein n=1 Tax=Pseudomonas guariconensis TaxID=1288410 RepID=UPI0018A8C121|nr:glycosyltransferase family 4 protein [Pseudomonas guariconensis]MBF8756133.1 glycosyltransferase family 4 protein [Pseudomonas guariconensis]
MNVWYVHPYAGGPGIGRYWRPFYFSYYWNRSGHRSTVLSASYHHLMEPDEQRRRGTTVDGVNYAYVPTLAYRGNGLGRMFSMLLFAVLLIPSCLVLAMRRGCPDAIIYSSPHPFAAISCWFAARMLRAKFVFEVRDIWPLSLVELGGWKATGVMTRLTGWIERFTYARSDKVISLLPCAEPHMRSKGLEPGKFLWIPNGVDISGPEPARQASKSSFARHIQSLRRQGFFVVIYAGAHGEPNALEGLVRSGALLKTRGAKVKIVLVGKGERKAYLQGIAEQCGGGVVEFHEQQPKEDIMAALSLASAGYISLKFQPLFRFGISPNKLWDYMLVGLPVIFACKAGNDPVGDSGCGISVDPECPEQIADAVKRLSLMSEDERCMLGRRGHEAVVADYTYEVLANKVLQGIDREQPA